MKKVDYANCKIIFTLRYLPTNNNWQPFANYLFTHEFYKFITVEYGIHIKNKNTCPRWIHPTSVHSFYSELVQEDILKYTCKSACGQDTDICQNVKSWNIAQRKGMNFSNGSVELWHLSLAINDLKTPDTCNFKPMFQHSHKFCDASWDEIEPVKVPDEIQKSYPQFIMVPITTNDESLHLRTLNNWCNKLWDSTTKLKYDINVTPLMMNSPLRSQ